MGESEADKTVDATKRISTPGKILAEARQAQGIQQNDVAKKLHLSVRVIKDIEADDYEHFSALIYLRGYLRVYARAVGISEKKVLAALDAMGVAKNIDRQERIVQRATSQLDIPMTSASITRKRRILPLMSFLIFVILVSLVVLWWQDQSRSVKLSLPNELRVEKQSQSVSSMNHTAIPQGVSQTQRIKPKSTSQKAKTVILLKKPHAKTKVTPKHLHSAQSHNKLQQTKAVKTKKHASAMTPNYTLDLCKISL